MQRIWILLLALATIAGCGPVDPSRPWDPTDANESPVQAGQPGKVAAGTGHTCALPGDGTVKCWGYNAFGQLGDGTVTTRTSPVLVTGSANVTWVTSGATHSCVAFANGAVQCWGGNTYGQLGNGTTTSSTGPVSVSGIAGATQVAAGEFHSCALLSGGVVKCWGYNGNGQLGNGTTTDSMSPVTAVASGAVTVTAGYEHTCAVLSNGTAQCWGYNGNGQLGDGTLVNRKVPTIVSGLSNAVGVTGGWYHTCAWLSDGTARCWGDNVMGGLGNGSNAPSATPVSVMGVGASGQLGSIAAMAAGKAYTIATLVDASVVAWGSNQTWTLGDYAPNTALCYPNNAGETQTPTATGKQCWAPFPIPGLGAGTAMAIAAGAYHAFALIGGANSLPSSADGWGDNSYGQIGNGVALLPGTPVSNATPTTSAYP